MHQRLVFTVLLVISLGVVAQESAPTPRVTDTPLTSEQIQIYRAVLVSYLKGSDRILNLANLTDPFDESSLACLKGVDSDGAKKSAPVIHRIDPSFVADTKIILVDPERQQETIKENDPQNLMMKAINDGQRITDEQLDQSIKRAFNSGLFTFSEIVFDKQHRHAAVSFSFLCGGLCGNGNTLVLKRVGRVWKVARRCSGWVS